MARTSPAQSGSVADVPGRCWPECPRQESSARRRGRPRRRLRSSGTVATNAPRRRVHETVPVEYMRSHRGAGIHLHLQPLLARISFPGDASRRIAGMERPHAGEIFVAFASSPARRRYLFPRAEASMPRGLGADRRRMSRSCAGESRHETIRTDAGDDFEMIQRQQAAPRRRQLHSTARCDRWRRLAIGCRAAVIVGDREFVASQRRAVFQRDLKFRDVPCEHRLAVRGANEDAGEVAMAVMHGRQRQRAEQECQRPTRDCWRSSSRR